MPNRKTPTFGNSKYRYGFNGKEADDEVYGDDQFQDYGMRIYNAGLGRFLSVDPIASSYPELTPYQFASNTPIQAVDLDGLESLVIIAQPTNVVNNTVIEVEKADFIVYNLRFIIEYPDGTVEELLPDQPLVMFENKSMQSGLKKENNAIKSGEEYDLEWKAFGSFDANQAIHIKDDGEGHSDYTYIHPLGTTAPADSGGGSYATGCKGIGYEQDMQVSEDGEDIFSGDPYHYIRSRGRGQDVSYPKPKEENKERNVNAWLKSYDAMKGFRKLWRDNKDKLQTEDNFKLRVEPGL